MKNIFIAAFCFVTPILISAQSFNKTIIEEKSSKPILVGLCDRTAFADTNFSWWYKSEYDNYETNKNDLDTIKAKIAGVRIVAVMGSWCSDSRREAPRLFKIIDELKIDSPAVKLICVDRDKKTEGTEIENLDIKLVPTFIFYRGEKELGRIVESPQTTLEGDIKSILNKNGD